MPSLRLPVVAVALTLFLASACSSSHGNHDTSSAPAPSTSVVSTSAAPTVTTTVTTPVTPATSTSAAAPLACTNAQIVVTGTADPAGGAAGHNDVLLLFTNSSSATCTLYGYPGAAGLNAAGTQIGQAARTLTGYMGGCGCKSLLTVTLAPNAVASTIVEGDVGGGDCTQFTALLVTPPNTTQSTRVGLAPYSCDFTIHPVIPGAAGRST